MIENDKLVRKAQIYDREDCIGIRKDCIITKEEFLECFNEWVIKPSQENPRVIDNCDMNVFDPEKYMRGDEE